MTSFLLEKDNDKRKKILSDMNSHAAFLHYAEGGKTGDPTTDHSKWENPWTDDETGAKNWLEVWSEGKKKVIAVVGGEENETTQEVVHFGEPPATLGDVQRLYNAILDGTCFAPASSKEMLKKVIILGDSKGVSNDKKIWDDGIKKLKDLLSQKQNVIVPLLAYFSYINDNKEKNIGRHWCAIVLRKRSKKELLEIFFVESAQNGLKINFHKNLVGKILLDLGIRTVPYVHNNALPKIVPGGTMRAVSSTHVTSTAG